MRNDTAEMQSRLVELARPHVKGWRLDSILQEARLLREIRNYGVHPRSAIGGIEGYFEEERCGLLFLTSADYFERLSDIVGELCAALSLPL